MEDFKSGYDLPPMALNEFLEATKKMPDRADAIEGILPAEELALLAGDPWQGKSLEHQMLGCAFGQGALYHGLKLKKCRALYITWEGATKGIGKRFKTLAKSYPSDLLPILKMQSSPIHLNTEQGRIEMFNIISSVKEKYSNLEVLLLDSFPYTCQGNYRQDDIVEAWYEGIMGIARSLQVTPIVIFELRKLTMWGGIPEEYFTPERLKGAKTIGYKAYSIIMTGEAKKQVNHEWIDDGHKIVIAKAKDAEAAFEPLTVTLNRTTLLYEGQEWKLNKEEQKYNAV